MKIFYALSAVQTIVIVILLYVCSNINQKLEKLESVSTLVQDIAENQNRIDASIASLTAFKELTKEKDVVRVPQDIKPVNEVVAKHESKTNRELADKKENAQQIFDNIISNGHMSNEQFSDFRTNISELSQQDRGALMSKLVNAINQQLVKIDGI